MQHWSVPHPLHRWCDAQPLQVVAACEKGILTLLDTDRDCSIANLSISRAPIQSVRWLRASPKPKRIDRSHVDVALSEVPGKEPEQIALHLGVRREIDDSGALIACMSRTRAFDSFSHNLS